jgi:CO/xanthine dehydrogenase Mo-binding subunit
MIALRVNGVLHNPTPAAIANALFAACGARLRDTPFTPARVRGALYAGE